MHKSHDNTVEFPTLSAVQVQLLLGQCADLTLLLSDDFTVVDILGSPEIDGKLFQHWIGQKLENLVSEDSKEKLSLLVEDNAARQTNETRWRHLNFIFNGKPDLPLLLKFFGFEGDGAYHHLICARDLRPMFTIQQRVQRVEKSIFDQRHNGSTSEHRTFEPWNIVAKVIAETGTSRADQEAKLALASIERLCILEALKEAEGNELKAAELLNISIDTLKEKLQSRQ